MSTPRIADQRQRDIEAAERLARQLRHRALQMQDWTKGEAEPDFKMWGIVSECAAEAERRLKEARGAPGSKRDVTIAVPYIQRDAQGVPPYLG